MRDRRRQPAILATVLLLTAGLFGGLLAGAPSAAAGGPPDDPGSQGQDRGKADEKRPDHAGQQGGKEGQGPPDRGPSSDDDADDQETQDDETQDDDPPTDDQTDPDSAEEDTTDQERSQEQTTVEPLEGQAPLVAPLVEPAVPEVGQLVHLDAGAWDPDGEIVAIDWFLPDGSWLTGAQVSHVFQAPGNHTLELVATDDQGYTTTVTIDVQILPATRPLQTPEAFPTTDDEVDAIWETGTDGDELLGSNALDRPAETSGSPPGLDPDRSHEVSIADRPLAVMGVITAFLVATVALVARAE